MTKTIRRFSMSKKWKKILIEEFKDEILSQPKGKPYISTLDVGFHTTITPEFEEEAKYFFRKYSSKGVSKL